MRSTSAGVIGIATYSARMRALTVIPKKPGTSEVREVPDPVPNDDEVVVDVVRVGLCGTDAEIDHGEYGVAPPGSDFLILGHESFGRVSRPARRPNGKATELLDSVPVVASVRRPDGCPNCSRGEADMCLWGDYTERGVGGLHGFCAERYAERPEYLFPVPEELVDVAVLLEPLTISEKGWRHVTVAQRRMTVWEPRRALVTGAGPVGILAAVVLRLRGMDVTVVERTEKPERRALLAKIGATYAATSITPLHDIVGSNGRTDVILEATGSSQVAFAAMDLIGPNGVLILTSVTGGSRSLEVRADDINRRLVLRNAMVLGTVNANAADFRQGLVDLAAAERRWPGFLLSLITRRVPLERAAEALRHDPSQIKQVVEIHP
jgi:threonine dehydrogenase-like Zn-dependent dehydrogenase